MDGDGRIEIELDSDGSAGDKAMGRVRSGEHDDEPVTDRRRTLVVAALVAGALGIGVGWAIGNSSGGSPSDAAPATVATAVTTNELSADTIAPPDAVPWREAITSYGAPVPATVAIAPELGGPAFEIAFSRDVGDVTVLNLAAGTVRRYDFPELGPIGTIVRYRNDGRLMAFGAQDPRAVATIAPDATATMQPLPADAVEVVFDGADQAWVIEREPLDGSLDQSTIRRLELPNPASIDINGRVVGADPAGGFLAQTAEGIVGNGSLVTTGTILAIDASRVLARECTGTESCDVVVVDRATGTRTPLELDVSAFPGDALSVEQWRSQRFQDPTSTVIGDVAYVTVTSASPGGNDTYSASIDLTTGVVKPLGASAAAGPVFVTDDFEWAFALTPDLELIAIDMATGTSQLVVTDSAGLLYGTWSSVAIGRLP